MSATTARTAPRPGSRSLRDKPRLVASAVPVERIATPADRTPPEKQEPLLLDVRRAPMAAQAGWTLSVLESLELGRRVLHVNTEVPVALFPMLETRGIRYRIQDREAGEVRILMWRHWEPGGIWPRELRHEAVRTP